MTTLDEFLKEFSPGSREKVKKAWNALPELMRLELETLIMSVPVQPQLLRRLIDISLRQFKLVTGQKRKIAILGPANVGKSTLYNQLIRSKADRAEVGPLPGTTRVNQEADAGFFSLVDTPGADAVGEVGEAERQQALAAASQADFIIMVFDAIQGIKKTEQELYDELTALKIPFLVVLNKIDLVKRAEQRVIEQVADNLHLDPAQMVVTNARDGRNVERVVIAMAKTDPEIVAALGQALPEFRWQLAWLTISGAAVTTALVGALPLPVVDFVPLIVVQTSMVLSIARIYAYKITPGRAKELIATFGLGFLGRALFQQLSKLGGLPGDVLASAIAASTTASMGYAAVVWFAKGERLTNASLQKLTRELTDALLQAFRSRGKQKGSKANLQQVIQATLANASIAHDRPPFATAAKTESETPPSDPGPGLFRGGEAV
jgi:GTPase